MALMPYRVAGAAVAAGAGYQGYLQALPMLEVVVDPKEMRSFARRQLRNLAAWVLNWSSDKEAGATKSQPLAAGQSAPAPKGGTDAASEFFRGVWQLAQQNTWVFALPCLAILWACSQAMQMLAGIYWAICAAARLIWRTGSFTCQMALWPLQLLWLACRRQDLTPDDDEVPRCTALCRCGLPCARSLYHKTHQLDATCLCDICINVALRPPSLPLGTTFTTTPEEELSEAQLRCKPRRGYNWAEPERLLQSGIYQGVPYTAMLADVNYMNTVRRQGTRPGMAAAGSYLNFVRRHEEAVAAGTRA